MCAQDDGSTAANTHKKAVSGNVYLVFLLKHYTIVMAFVNDSDGNAFVSISRQSGLDRLMTLSVSQCYVHAQMFRNNGE